MTGSIEMADTGANLALRALGWGTVIAVLGTGSFMFAIWKLSGAKDVRNLVFLMLHNYSISHIYSTYFSYMIFV